MDNSIFYNIGGITIEIFGENAQDITQLTGFKTFETKDNKSLAAIELVSKYEEFMTLNMIYSLNYENISFHCFKVSEYEYGFKILDTTNVDKLSVKYNANTQSCVVGGKSDPSMLLFAMWVAYGVVALQYKLIAVHSSVIMCNGKAVMFLGESGTGKSTHTRLWRETIKDAILLNDDSPILQVIDDKVYVYGSPWSGKTPCFCNEKAELIGIVRLSQAPHNEIKPLRVIEAFAALYPSCPPVFANDNYFSQKVCQIISDTLNNVKVWHLECLPDKEAAKLSFTTIFQK